MIYRNRTNEIIFFGEEKFPSYYEQSTHLWSEEEWSNCDIFWQNNERDIVYKYINANNLYLVYEQGTHLWPEEEWSNCDIFWQDMRERLCAIASISTFCTCFSW
jgi:hypothetical protein